MVVRCLSDSDNILPDDAHLFIEVSMDSNEVKKIEQFAKEPPWLQCIQLWVIHCQSSLLSFSKCEGYVAFPNTVFGLGFRRLLTAVHRSDNLPSTRLTVMMEYPSHDFQRLSFMELDIAAVLARREIWYIVCLSLCYLYPNTQTFLVKIVRAFTQTSNSLPLGFVCRCVVVFPQTIHLTSWKMKEET